MAKKMIKKMDLKIQDEDYTFDFTNDDLTILTVNEQLVKLATLQSKGKNMSEFSIVKQIVILDKYLKWCALERRSNEADI